MGTVKCRGIDAVCLMGEVPYYLQVVPYTTLYRLWLPGDNPQASRALSTGLMLPWGVPNAVGRWKIVEKGLALGAGRAYNTGFIMKAENDLREIDREDQVTGRS